jgi:hypothetical protein
MDWLVDVVSGEKFMDLLGKPNGGTMVFLRSLWVTALVFFVALGLRSLFNAKWPWSFDGSEYVRDLPETLPWVGAIFAFTYLALYSRFSSQWSYLAGFYNQIMATQAQIEGTAPSIGQMNPNANKKIQIWKAAFIEDAQDLHLATKKMFSVAIWTMLEDPNVYDNFVGYTADGKARVKKLVKALKDAIPKFEELNPDEQLLKGERPGDNALAWNTLGRLIGPHPRP